MWMRKAPAGFGSTIASGAKNDWMPALVVHAFHTSARLAPTTTSLLMTRSADAAGGGPGRHGRGKGTGLALPSLSTAAMPKTKSSLETLSVVRVSLATSRECCQVGAPT